MKRYCALFLVIVMVVVCFSSCVSQSDSAGDKTGNYFASEITTETGSELAPIEDDVFRVGFSNLKDVETLEYTGEAIELECYVKIPQNRVVSFVVFTDGFIQPYSIDGEDCKYMQKLSSGTYTLSFHPVSGKMGETVQFVSCVLNCPGFEIVDDDNYLSFQLNNSLYPNAQLEIELKADAPEISPETENNTYVKEIENVFRDLSGMGEGGTAGMTQTDFRIYDTILDADKVNESNRQNEIVAQKNTEHEIFICGYGKTGKYRVMLFINDELQNLFGGKAYLDMEIEQEKQTTYSFKVNTENLNKENYIYLIYYPLDLDINDIWGEVRKTYSSIFYVN